MEGSGKIFQDHMVFKGNGVGISRHQQSIKGRLWKIDCKLSVIRIFQSIMGESGKFIS